MTRRLSSDTWLSLLSIAVFFAGWYVVTAIPLVPANLLPPLSQVGATFLDVLRHGYRGTSLAEDVGATLGRCLAGFLLAV